MHKSQKGLIRRTNWLLQSFIPKLFSPNWEACIYCNSPRCKNKINSIGLCNSCTLTIPWIREVICSVCGRYLGCTDCSRREETHFIKNRSAVEYSNEMKDWLARYKYRGDESLLPLLVEMLRFPFEALKHELLKSLNKLDYITYIPLSPERLTERGFNQAEQLAQGIGKLYSIPVVPLLKRVLHTGKQSYKTRGQRLSDLQHVFKYEGNPSLQLKGNAPLNILLVDDVYTTGSTLNQASSVIRQHLNAQVYGLTWAR